MATVTEIRQWLRDRGHEVSDRGRISRELREMYEAEHPDEFSDIGVSDPSPFDEEVFVAEADEVPDVPVTEETRPRRPRTPLGESTAGKLFGSLLNPKPKTQERGGPSRGPRGPRKPKRPRVSLDRFLSRVYTRGGQLLSGFAPATGRCLQAQSAMAGVILEDIAKNTFADRVLQPMARAEDKLDKTFALVAPPALVLALEMTAPDDMLRKGIIMTMLREALLISMDVTAQYSDKIAAQAARSAENEAAVDSLLAFILGVPQGEQEPVPDMAAAA